LHVVVTQNSGKINWNMIDLATPFTITGGFVDTASSTMTATTTIADTSLTNGALVINGLPYKFSSSRGAANSVLTEDGTGNVSFSPATVPRYTYATTTLISAVNGYATSSPIVIPASFVTASSSITVKGTLSCNNNGSATGGNCTYYIRDASGNTLVNSDALPTTDSISGTGVGNFTATIYLNNSVSSQISQMICSYIEVPNSSFSNFQYDLCNANQNTTSLNWANAFNLYVVVRSNSTNMTARLSNAFFEVDR